MAQGIYSTSMRQPIAIIILVCLLLQSTAGITQAEFKNYQDDWNEDITVTGGRTILVEELSTTWCTNCAEIDPYLQQVADAHGSRITIVTYHPTDGEDAFQPPAADYRIQRMKLVNDQLGSTPTFVVESGLLRVGSESWPDVQKDILKAETSRQEVSEVAFIISQEGDNYSASVSTSDLMEVTYDTQLTFMLMAHGIKVPDGYINVGEEYRDRVVISTASCSLNSSAIQNIGFSNSNTTNCAEDFTVNFSYQGKFSLVLIHEATNEVIESDKNLATTLGVVEFAYRDIDIEDQVNLMPMIFITTIAIGFIWAIISKKGY